MSAPIKINVPVHLTPAWLAAEAGRRKGLGGEGKPRKTIYIHPKRLSIREVIATAEQLKKAK